LQGTFTEVTTIEGCDSHKTTLASLRLPILCVQRVRRISLS